jgi:hypothetical protein
LDTVYVLEHIAVKEQWDLPSLLTREPQVP